MKKGDRVKVVTPQNETVPVVETGTVDSVTCDEMVIAVSSPHRNYLLAVDPKTYQAKGCSNTFIIAAN